MDVAEVLKQAWQAAVGSGVPNELHRDAFLEAVRLLTTDVPTSPPETDGAAANDTGSRSTPAKKVAPRKAPTGSPKSTPEQSDSIALDEKQFLTKLAEESGVPTEKLERVFHLEKGTLHVSLSKTKLGGSAKNRMSTIGELISTARAFVLVEDGTPVVAIREECRRLGTLDRNINTYLEQLDGFSYVGGRNDKRLKPRTAAEKAFPSVVDRVLGESSEESA